MLLMSLTRLEEIIEQETAALMSRDYSGLEESNRNKSQSLLEVTRLARSIQNIQADPDLMQRLHRLRAKLEENHQMLDRHMRAVREIDDLVSRAIQKANSDGTYKVPTSYMGSSA